VVKSFRYPSGYIGRVMRLYSKRAALIAVRPGVSTSMIVPPTGA